MSCQTWDKYDVDAAWYDLGTLDCYAGDDDEFRAAYAQLLVKLPQEVRCYALSRCYVFSIGRAWGITWPARIIDKRRTKWIIIMDENNCSDFESGIAHELAHAWLRHDRVSPDIDPNCEVAADDLVEEWGFSRSYDHSGNFLPL